MNFRARLKALEQQRRQVSASPFRVIVCGYGGPPNLANSTCTRRLGASGQLTEIVYMDGGDKGLTDEDLETFSASFPVERV